VKDLNYMIFGIDPGQKGGIVAMDEGSLEVIEKWTMDYWTSAVKYALDAAMGGRGYGKGPVTMILESAQPMPKQGVVSVFTYGKGYGRLIGWLEAEGLPYQEVKPAVWVKDICQGIPGGLEKKERNREAFRRLYPQFYAEVCGRTGKPHSGLMDACLIARWGCKHAV